MICRPKRISKVVIEVVQIDVRGWRSSHPRTVLSGVTCIRTESTLVSRMIIAALFFVCRRFYRVAAEFRNVEVDARSAKQRRDFSAQAPGRFVGFMNGG